MNYLLTLGADINAKTIMGTTALHMAASEGHVEAIKFLINKGANVTAKNELGTTPLHIAMQNGNLKAITLLISNGINMYEIVDLLHAAMLGGVKTFMSILEQYELSTLTTQDKTSLYSKAFSYDEPKMLEILINIGITSEEYTIPYMLRKAVDNAHAKILDWLISKGAELSTPDPYSKSLLNIAVNRACSRFTNKERIQKRLEVVETLLKANIDIDEEDFKGETALHLAVTKNGKPELIELLLKYGADIYKENNQNKTPLDLAKAKGRSNIVKLLEEYSKTEADKIGASTQEAPVKQQIDEAGKFIDKVIAAKESSRSI